VSSANMSPQFGHLVVTSIGLLDPPPRRQLCLL
jgi:hypothetical protein